MRNFYALGLVDGVNVRRLVTARPDKKFLSYFQNAHEFLPVNFSDFVNAQLVEPLPNFQLNLREVADAPNYHAVINFRADNFRRHDNFRRLAEVQNQFAVRHDFRQNIFVARRRSDFNGRIDMETVQAD